VVPQMALRALQPELPSSLRRTSGRAPKLLLGTPRRRE
jgi:hypothetical protein